MPQAGTHDSRRGGRWTRYRVFLTGFLPVGVGYTMASVIAMVRGEEAADRLAFGLGWIAIGLLVQAVLIGRGRRRERDDSRDGQGAPRDR